MVWITVILTLTAGSFKALLAVFSWSFTASSAGMFLVLMVIYNAIPKLQPAIIATAGPAQVTYQKTNGKGGTKTLSYPKLYVAKTGYRNNGQEILGVYAAENIQARSVYYFKI